MPKEQFGYALAGASCRGSTKTSAMARAAKSGRLRPRQQDIGTPENPIPMDGVCVRIGAMRCHSQALTIKLKRNLPLAEIESLLNSANDWVEVVPNTREASLSALTPVEVTGTLQVPIGRCASCRWDRNTYVRSR
jgi:aspartate-semialdehyde dehydrogenase